MDTYTLGSFEMLGAMAQRLPAKYEMTLNTADMTALLTALATAVGFVSWDDVAGSGRADQAASLLSSIAETLGIEGI